MEWRRLAYELAAIATIIKHNILNSLPTASGKLRESINTTLEENGDEHKIVLSSEDYLKYTEGGRRAGAKMPPVKAIEEWCGYKGIPKQKAFAIARGISLNGIAPRPVVEPSIPNDINDRISKAASEDVNDIINEKISKF